VEFTILAFLLWLCATFTVGILFDSPRCAAMRARLAPPRMKLLAVVLGLSPALSIITGSAKPFGVVLRIDRELLEFALQVGSMLTAALAGSWLALPVVPEPRSRPALASLLSLFVWLANILLLRLQ
jgi:hypothetical protein